MTASTATRLLSAGALAAALAGCSGAAQLAPAGGLGAQSVARKPATQSARQPAAGDLFASAGAVAFASRQLRLPGESTGFESTGPKASTGDSILFISASMSGSVYAYDRAAVTASRRIRSTATSRSQRTKIIRRRSSRSTRSTRNTWA